MLYYLDLLNEDTNIFHTLLIKPLDNTLGQAWSAMLTKAIDDGFYCNEPKRIYALNDKWNNDGIMDNIKGCINIINEYKEGTIEFKDNLNYLHKYFEDFMLPDTTQHQFYLDAPEEVKEAIREFNILIHRREHSKRLSKHGKIVVSLDHENIKLRQKRRMTEEEASSFNNNIIAGDVVLKYCHKGKKILDIFIDDEITNRHVSAENITPHTDISPDFKIYFKDPFRSDFPERWEKWLVKNKQFFVNANIDLEDPMNTVGFGKVGKVIGDINKIEEQLIGITKIVNVRYN
jgi:hypothetical protein